MSRYPNSRALFESAEFKFLSEGKYKPTAWAYVERGKGEQREILVVERFKKEDPLRKGQLVIPGGGVKTRENYDGAAKREVREEASLQTHTHYPARFGKSVKNTIVKPRGNVIGILTPALSSNPDFWIVYRDSGKKYFCKTIDLDIDGKIGLKENPKSDARNPHFLKVRDIVGRRNEFTPAVQLFLELVESAYFEVDLFRQSDLVVEGNSFRHYLRVGDPE